MPEENQENLAQQLLNIYEHHLAVQEIRRHNRQNDVIEFHRDVTESYNDVTNCDGDVILQERYSAQKHGYQPTLHLDGCCGHVSSDVTGCDVIWEKQYIQIEDCQRPTGGLSLSWGEKKRTRNFWKSRGYHGNYPKSLCRKGGLLDWITTIAITFSFLLLMPSASHADYYSDYVKVIMKNRTQSACDGEYLRIDCPEGTSIHVLGAMYGRKVPSSEMCPGEVGGGSGDVDEDLNCEAVTSFEVVAYAVIGQVSDEAVRNDAVADWSTSR